MSDKTITEKGSVTLDESDLDQASGGASFLKIKLEGAQAPTAPVEAVSLNFTKIEF